MPDNINVEGPKRNTALTIQQMISLAELAVNRALDHLDPPESPH